MTALNNRTGRLFSLATLIAALGLPMTACAQTPVAEHESAHAEAQAPVKAVEVETVQAKPAEAGEDSSASTMHEAVKPEKKPKTAEELAIEKQKKELETLQREAMLRAAKLADELAPLKLEKERIETQIALLKAKQQEAQAKAQVEKDQADFAFQMENAQAARQLQQLQQSMQQLQVQTQIAQLKQQSENAEISANNAKLAAQVASLQAELGLLNTQRTAASVDKDPMQYPSKPLEGKTLTISDRRIPLNGAISTGTADYVTERIHYYNNLDPKAPIFLCIDASPGGSVMEGYRIVTAMQNSEAPVHVVVKSYAASMAAVITTLATESYAYPNAIILHHQMSSSMRGNLTQQKESLEDGMDWARRLADPVAEKMGLSYEQLVKEMYKNNSDGDWAEFGDKAVKLKWVNHVVTEIRETALVTAPSSIRYAMMEASKDSGTETQAAGPQPFTQEELFRSPIQLQTKADGNGKLYTELPPLAPFDYYFMYDPGNHFRIAE